MADQDDAHLVARLLQHSVDLFGEPLLGAPAEYPDLRRLLAVISEAYHNRHKLRKPARVAYINYRQGNQPDLKYWDATHRFLPKEFHQKVGLPYRNPYLDWATPEDPLLELGMPEEEPPARCAPGVEPSSIRSWQDSWRSLRSDTSRADCAQYLDDLTLLDFDPNAYQFTIGCQDADAQTWLQENVEASLERKMSGYYGKKIGVRFIVWTMPGDG